MFDRQAFIDNILDHYEHPRHRGPMPDATVSIKGGNPGCGDIIEAHLKLDDQERIADVSFEGEGMDHTQFIEDLGREVVINRLKCATLALNTVKAAERKYHEQQAHGAAPDAPTNEVISF